jgi:MFS transporter, SP family, sugar:H+ symporter
MHTSSLGSYSNDRQRMSFHLRLCYDLGSVGLSLHCVKPIFKISRSGVWILIGETFPTRTRAKQAALASASNWWAPPRTVETVANAYLCSHRLWNFLLAFLTPFIVKAINFKYGFVFAGNVYLLRSVSISTSLLRVLQQATSLVQYSSISSYTNHPISPLKTSILCVVSLPSVRLISVGFLQMYNDPDCTPWTSSSWVPAGFISRYDLIQHDKVADMQKAFAHGIHERAIEKLEE